MVSDNFTEFRPNAEKSGAKVHEIREQDTSDKVSELIDELGSENGNIVFSGGFDRVSMSFEKTDARGNVINAEQDEGRFAAVRNADIGVTEARFGVAELGVVGVELSSGNEGIVSLVPEVHIAVLKEKDIMSDSTEVFSFLGEKIREGRDDWVFIAGPSSTAENIDSPR